MPGARPRVRGGPANRARWANRGGAQHSAPAHLPGGLSCRPPPVENRPGGVACEAGLREPVRGPYPPPGAHEIGSRRGTDGAAVHYRPPPFPPSLLQLRAPPRPSVLIVSFSPSFSPSSSPPPYEGAAAMNFSRATTVAPTEEMASPRAGRAVPASSGTPASATAISGIPAAGTPRVGGAQGSTGAPKAKNSTAATLRAAEAAASAPATPAGATHSSGAASAAARRKAARRSRLSNGAPMSRESSAAGSQATQPPPPPLPVQVSGGFGVGLSRVELGDAFG